MLSSIAEVLSIEGRAGTSQRQTLAWLLPSKNGNKFHSFRPECNINFLSLIFCEVAGRKSSINNNKRKSLKENEKLLCCFSLSVKLLAVAIVLEKKEFLLFVLIHKIA